MPTMPPTALYADYLLDGALKRKLQTWRNVQNNSWQQVARLLSDETDGLIAVTDQTVANWATKLGVK